MEYSARDFLRTGFIVVWRCGRVGVVMNDYLGTEGSVILDVKDVTFIYTDDYDSDFNNAAGSDEWDIMDILKPLCYDINPWDFDFATPSHYCKSVWRRKDTNNKEEQ